MSLKERIIKSAYECFSVKGYDETTVQEIIEKAQSSKGGFYHHFSSKEEILLEIINAYIREIRKIYQQILDDDSMSFSEKFLEGMVRINQYKENQVDEWPRMKRVFDFKGNHILIMKISQSFEYETLEFYKKLFEYYNEKKVIHVKYPMQLAALWSREVIRLHRLARKAYIGRQGEMRREYSDMLSFSEEWINREIGNGNLKISIKRIGLEYVEDMENQIKDMEGLL